VSRQGPNRARTWRKGQKTNVGGSKRGAKISKNGRQRGNDASKTRFRGGDCLLEWGIGEMIGGADLVRGDRGPPTNRVWFDQMTLKEGQRVGDRREKKVRSL
jgi:hypothetical protein